MPDNALSDVIPAGTIYKTSVGTKIHAKASKVWQHTLEFDLSGITIGRLAELATQSTSLVVEFQRRFRAHPEQYPEGSVSVKVADLRSGRRPATVVLHIENVEDLVRALTSETVPEHVKALLRAQIVEATKADVGDEDDTEPTDEDLEEIEDVDTDEDEDDE